MMLNQEREAFAEWVRKHPDFSGFESYEIDNLFDAWLARAAIEVGRQVRLCECQRKTAAIIDTEREL